MIYFRPCYLEHIVALVPQPEQEEERQKAVNEFANMIESSYAVSAWIDEKCVAAAGVRNIWEGRNVVWALFSKDAGRIMFPILRRMVGVLESFPAGRIEMAVRADFRKGCRLAELLGFHNETPEGMPGFFPDGATGYLYARVTT